MKGLKVIFNILTLSIATPCQYAECCCSECHDLFIVMMNVIVLSVIILSGFMLNVVILSVVAPQTVFFLYMIFY
jgi:hypothetical protein